MRKSSFAAPLVLAALTAGCSFVPPLGKLTSPVADQFPGDTAGQVPADIAWQKLFTDPRLRKIVEGALANNRDLRIATLNVEQSRAQYSISRSQLFPTLNLTGSSNRQRGLGAPGFNDSNLNFTAYAASVGLVSYELDLFGRVRSLNGAALASYFATDAARLSAQISLVAEVASQYLTERALEEQAALSQQTYDGFDLAYGLMKQRFDSGTVSELDLSAMDVQRQTARADLAAVRQRLLEIHNSLVFLAGGSLPANLPSARPLDQAILAEVKAGSPSSLLLRRPDIREAEYQLRAANANIGAARAAFFPRISLTSDVGSSSRDLSHLLGAGSNIWQFSPEIRLPIFDGGRNRANLDVAEIRKTTEIARYEKAIQTAFREVADALAARGGLAERIAATESLVAAQQKRTDLATARYTKGVDSYLEALTATLDLYSTRQTLIQLRLSRALNRINLYKALGGGA
jgi:outer membrane protein, multidrug efflux system